MFWFVILQNYDEQNWKTSLRRNSFNTFLKFSLCLQFVLYLIFTKIIHFQKVERIVASDEDLKLSDTLRYYMGDSFAAKRLLYRRLRCLANYENANRNLEKARVKNKDVHAVSFSFRSKLLSFRIDFYICFACSSVEFILLTY